MHILDVKAVLKFKNLKERPNEPTFLLLHSVTHL